ncbi:MAG: hypothetical protein V9H26_17305 [Verrucomicrobiota bacterium]
MTRRRATLDRARTNRVARDLCGQVYALGDALFQSIRMQLSVERHRAIAPDRGATLDTIDLPLNNRLWLTGPFPRHTQLAGRSVASRGYP